MLWQLNTHLVNKVSAFNGNNCVLGQLRIAHAKIIQNKDLAIVRGSNCRDKLVNTSIYAHLIYSK